MSSCLFLDIFSRILLVWFYEECFSCNFTVCLSSRALEPVDQVQPRLMERSEPQIPITTMIISRCIKEADHRNAGNVGGLGTAWTVCVLGIMAFRPISPCIPACVLVWVWVCVAPCSVSWRSGSMGGGRSLRVCGGHGREKAVTAECEIKSWGQFRMCCSVVIRTSHFCMGQRNK